MKKTLAIITLAITMVAVPISATACPAKTRLVYKDKILLRLEGGECRTNGTLEPTNELWIVPTLVKVGKKWVPGENTEVRVLVDPGGQPCT